MKLLGNSISFLKVLNNALLAFFWIFLDGKVQGSDGSDEGYLHSSVWQRSTQVQTRPHLSLGCWDPIESTEYTVTGYVPDPTTGTYLHMQMLRRQCKATDSLDGGNLWSMLRSTGVLGFLCMWTDTLGRIRAVKLRSESEIHYTYNIVGSK